MEKVFKICMGIPASEILLSVFPHSKALSYRIGETTEPKVGYLYAFSEKEKAIQWIKSLSNDHVKVITSQILANNTELSLVTGETTVISCKFSNTIRHIAIDQLKEKELLNAFWSSGTGKRFRGLLIEKDVDGTILIPNFVPKEIEKIDLLKIR